MTCKRPGVSLRTICEARAKWDLLIIAQRLEFPDTKRRNDDGDGGGGGGGGDGDGGIASRRGTRYAREGCILMHPSSERAVTGRLAPHKLIARKCDPLTAARFVGDFLRGRSTRGGNEWLFRLGCDR